MSNQFHSCAGVIPGCVGRRWCRSFRGAMSALRDRRLNRHRSAARVDGRRSASGRRSVPRASRPASTARASRPWFNVVFGVLCLACVVAAVLLLGPPATTQQAQSRVVTAERGVVQSTVSGSGTLAPADQVNLNFKTSGVLSAVYVTPVSMLPRVSCWLRSTRAALRRACLRPTRTSRRPRRSSRRRSRIRAGPRREGLALAARRVDGGGCFDDAGGCCDRAGFLSGRVGDSSGLHRDREEREHYAGEEQDLDAGKSNTTRPVRARPPRPVRRRPRRLGRARPRRLGRRDRDYLYDQVDHAREERDPVDGYDRGDFERERRNWFGGFLEQVCGSSSSSTTTTSPAVTAATEAANLGVGEGERPVCRGGCE